MKEAGGRGPKMRQYLRVVLAVTPGISCAHNSKVILNSKDFAAQVMPGNQTCRFETVSSPLGDWLTHKPFPPPAPTKQTSLYERFSQQQ